MFDRPQSTHENALWEKQQQFPKLIIYFNLFDTKKSQHWLKVSLNPIKIFGISIFQMLKDEVFTLRRLMKVNWCFCSKRFFCSVIHESCWETRDRQRRYKNMWGNNLTTNVFSRVKKVEDDKNTLDSRFNYARHGMSGDICETAN